MKKNAFERVNIIVLGTNCCMFTKKTFVRDCPKYEGYLKIDGCLENYSKEKSDVNKSIARRSQSAIGRIKDKERKTRCSTMYTLKSILAAS